VVPQLFTRTEQKLGRDTHCCCSGLGNVYDSQSRTLRSVNPPQKAVFVDSHFYHIVHQTAPNCMQIFKNFLGVTPMDPGDRRWLGGRGGERRGREGMEIGKEHSFFASKAYDHLALTLA
jgi:hypothetical protein